MSDDPEKTAVEERVPAFEASLGLPMPAGEPETVSKRALDRINDRIREEQKDALKYHQEAAQVASLFAKRAIRPDEIAALRRQMFEVVKKGLVEVDQVIMGKKNWSPTQTRLFAILTERVMPKLSNITVEEKTSKLEDLSIEELEAIALGKKKAEAVDAVIKKAEVYDEQADKFERRETKKEVVRQLSYIDALDKAEKEYIARQIDKPLAELAEEEVRKKAKPQPKFTPEQLENVRKARRKSVEEIWRERGFSDEEIEQKKKAWQAKILESKARIRAAKLERLAIKQGLGNDEIDMAKRLRNERLKSLREFRVPPAKGVRSPTALAREAMEREKKARRQEHLDRHVRVYDGKSYGLTEEEAKGLTVSKLRELRPELYEEDEE